MTLKVTESGGRNLDGSAMSSVDTNCGAIGVAGGDFLQNGNFDLLLTSSCQSSVPSLTGYVGTTFYAPNESRSSNSVLYNTYHHLQSAHEIYTHGQTVDVNGDGRLDAFFLGSSTVTFGDLIYAMNNRSGNFTFTKRYSSIYFEGAAVADFNGDKITILQRVMIRMRTTESLQNHRC